jgi:hypothetical protein
MNAYILLDRSGSMETLWTEAIGSINGYVENLPNKAKVMLALFDNVSYDVIRDTTAKEWKNLDSKEFEPRGGTPLFDSSARMMQRILDDNPERAVFVVMTDGFENASQNFKQADVKSLSDQLKKKNYEVIFLGANFDKVGDVALNYGVAANKFTNITPMNLRGTMADVSHMSASYMTTGAAINISDDIKMKATATNSK